MVPPVRTLSEEELHDLLIFAFQAGVEFTLGGTAFMDSNDTPLPGEIFAAFFEKQESQKLEPIPVVKDRETIPFWPGDIVEHRAPKLEGDPPGQTMFTSYSDNPPVYLSDGARFEVVAWGRGQADPYYRAGGCLYVRHPTIPQFVIVLDDRGFVVVDSPTL